MKNSRRFCDDRRAGAKKGRKMLHQESAYDHDRHSSIRLVPSPFEAVGPERLDACSKPLRTTIVIERRKFVRECLARGLLALKSDAQVESHESVEDWLASAPASGTGLVVLLSMAERSPSDLKHDWKQINAAMGPSLPVVVIAEEENAAFVVEALNGGIRGYIPTSMTLAIAVEVLDLVHAGGTFIPASLFIRPGFNAGHAAKTETAPGHLPLSGRQADVVMALRKGTSNKIIAHDLGMAESTVKVHVRNIMRKLKARNRTHVAFLVNELDATHW
jgi:DNA-binding NarL/FixJ family response regulator